MRWEIIDIRPKVGEIRFKTKFAFFPTQVLSKLTNTDHVIWLELYIEEQVYKTKYNGWDGDYGYWAIVSKTIHI